MMNHGYAVLDVPALPPGWLLSAISEWLLHASVDEKLVRLAVRLARALPSHAAALFTCPHSNVPSSKACEDEESSVHVFIIIMHLPLRDRWNPADAACRSGMILARQGIPPVVDLPVKLPLCHLHGQAA